MVVNTCCRKSFYSPVRTIVSRISSRDLPCHKTKRSSSRAMSPSQVYFQLLWRRFVIRTFVCAHLKYFRSICIHVECIPCTRVHDKMSVLPDHCCLNYFSHVGLKFCLLPAIFCHPRIQIGIDLAAFDAKKCIPKGVLPPILVPRELFESVFPTIIPKVGDHADFVQKGTTGSSMLDQAFGKKNLCNCHDGKFSSFSHSSSTAAFESGTFIARGIATNLCTKL